MEGFAASGFYLMVADLEIAGMGAWHVLARVSYWKLAECRLIMHCLFSNESINLIYTSSFQLIRCIFLVDALRGCFIKATHIKSVFLAKKLMAKVFVIKYVYWKTSA